ncbi:hypothetical protein SAMN05421749_101542 [Acinetobacter marinus]|uniref:Uncharacterized protein n=1 Tax=Acinetobacter marinus TaxID=281375 RepID=A0A1G6GXF7_9GAMM|nr:hypothetical protein SAMN05421749_101542 [Acinetobacter marinus]
MIFKKVKKMASDGMPFFLMYSTKDGWTEHIAYKLLAPKVSH